MDNNEKLLKEIIELLKAILESLNELKRIEIQKC